MGRIIDADKQLEWMDKNYYRYETKNDFFEGISEAIKRGLFDPDPIPLPTIKPGDKVVITDAMNYYFIGTKAIVENISASSPYSAKLKGIHGDWPLSSLEVSHD